MNRLGPRTRLLVDSLAAIGALLWLVGVVIIELVKGLIEGDDCKEKA